MNLTKTNWPGGWQPSIDPLNGPPTGLLRMDNLRQDDEGIVSLVRGLKKINTANLSDYISQIYSKNINGVEKIWASLGSTGNSIVRGSLNGGFSEIANGTNAGAFGDAFGNVLIVAGQTRIKDSGTQIQNLGLLTPGAPTVAVSSQPIVNVSGTWSSVEGTTVSSSATAITASPNITTLRGVQELAFSTNVFDIGGTHATNPDNDIFQFKFTPDDSQAITKITVYFVLDNDNYFQHSWIQDDLVSGVSQISTLTCQRGDFVRQGSNPLLDWTNPTKVDVSVECTSVIQYTIDSIKFIGGSQGQLNGVYNWIQVNVNDNGFYQAKSPASVASKDNTVINGHVVLTPSTVEAQVTEIWFYRITVVGSQVGNQQSFLDKYYRVATCKPGQTATDTTSDDDAIRLNLVLNSNLSTLAFADDNGVKDDIFSMEGIYHERMLYMTFKELLLSERLNPDAIDLRYTVKVGGDPTEFNLWIRKLTNNVLILATSKNLYEVSGTLEDLPDGSIDINVVPLGEKYPPLSLAGGNACSAEGSIFYVAADGIRFTTGSNSELLSPELRLLFQGENRAGLPAILVSAGAQYALSLGKTKLCVILPFVDGSRRLVIFDLVKKQWRIQITDPVSVFTTYTDKVLLGFNTGSGGQLFELDSGTGIQNPDGSFIEGTPIYFQTIFDDNGQPRNRKDTFTLKLVMDTGGRGVSVSIAKTTSSAQNVVDNSAWVSLGSVTSSGKETFYFALNADNITLGFKYALRIVDTLLLTDFKLYEYTIEYDPRPEQLNYLRIQPDNLGTICRKRFVDYAFVIDTLGNSILFTPILDNTVSGNTSIANTPVKQTYIHYFKEEEIGTDISGILSGGVFEFYGLKNDEIVSEKLPVPVKFLVIPANDYGNPNRKRHSSYKFQIHTRGKNVRFTPKIDGAFTAPLTINTTEKRTVEYFFTVDTIGIDIGGTLESLEDTPFEFYGTITPQQIEVLPARLEYFRIPNNNLGVAARKRVRTIPIIIDTYGRNVTFTPIVDGVRLTSSILNSGAAGKTTLLHYFDYDTFGIDYAGDLECDAGPFEFYELGQFESVEVLPVGKKYDQLGPLRFDKIGKILGFRVKLIDLGNTNMPFTLFGDGDITDPAYALTNSYASTFPVLSGIDEVYEIQFPKNINLTMCRLVLGPTSFPFHRYDVQIRVSDSGMESDAKWIPIR